MGKYTSLARTLRSQPEGAKPEEDKGSSQKNTCVNISNNDKIIDSNPPAESRGSVTTIRPTTLTTLILDEKDETNEKPSKNKRCRDSTSRKRSCTSPMPVSA